MDGSARRQRLRQRYEQMAPLIEEFLAREPVFAASLYEQKIRCGKRGCRCAEGDYRHVLWCVSFVDGGHSCTRSVPDGIREEVRRLTEEHRACRQAQRQLRKLFAGLLKDGEALVAERCRQGRKRFDRLVQVAREGHHG
jgi:hypothetical protein